MQIFCEDLLSVPVYKKFIARVYQDNPFFRDSLSGILDIVTNSKGTFARRTRQTAITVRNDNGEPLALALLLCARGMPDTVQLSFFEALPNAEKAVQTLIDKAIEIARQWGAKNLLVSMNGHLNYGLGFLTDHFDTPPCFGSSYTPPYYPDYFLRLGFAEKRLVSYCYSAATFSMQRETLLLERIKKLFSFRKADFSRLEEEISIYTDLNNQCFTDHPLYFHRHKDEDYELFKPFRWFLREENLLIAEHGGIPVGFLLWYPDFNELIGPGQELGLTALLKHKIFRRPIKRFKIAEIGVIPKFQGSGAILGLLHACFLLAKDRFQECESNWIFSENLKSNNICRRWNPKPGPTFSAFSLDLE
jgi:hypothetical protein